MMGQKGVGVGALKLEHLQGSLSNLYKALDNVSLGILLL